MNQLPLGKITKKNGPQSAVMLNPRTIDKLKKQHPQHAHELALAAHCVKVASLDSGEKISLGKEKSIAPSTLTEWLLDLVEQVPEPNWGHLRDAVVLMMELLEKQHPEDVGLSVNLIVLSTPDGYHLQKRINLEERLVDLLLLEGKPTLIEAIGLPGDCVRDHSEMA